MLKENKFDISLSVCKGSNNVVLYFHEQVTGEETQVFYAQYVASLLANYVLAQLDEALFKYPLNTIQLELNSIPINLSLFQHSRSNFSVELYKKIINALQGGK